MRSFFAVLLTSMALSGCAAFQCPYPGFLYACAPLLSNRSPIERFDQQNTNRSETSGPREVVSVTPAPEPPAPVDKPTQPHDKPDTGGDGDHGGDHHEHHEHGHDHPHEGHEHPDHPGHDGPCGGNCGVGNGNGGGNGTGNEGHHNGH